MATRPPRVGSNCWPYDDPVPNGAERLSAALARLHSWPLLSAWLRKPHSSVCGSEAIWLTDLSEVGVGVQRAGLRVVGQRQVVERHGGVLQRLVERRALLDQHLGDAVDVGDVLAEDVAVLLDEGRDVAEADRQVVQRRRQLLLLAGEQVGDVGERLVELPHGLVVGRQGAEEALELTGRAEQRLLVVVEGLAQGAEVLDGLVELRALAAEVLGGGGEQVGQGAVLVRAVGAECDVQLVEAGVDLVELQRYAGVLVLEDGAVGELGAALVDRGELDVAVTDDGRRHDHGLGVGRDVDAVVVVHLDDHVGAARRDLVDGPDLDAEHLDRAALVDRDGAREVRGELLGLLGAEHGEPGGHHEGKDAERDDQPLGQVRTAHPTPPPFSRSGAGGMFWM